jgi:hypothetical protein
MGKISAKTPYRSINAPTETIPHLSQGILSWHKQNKRIFRPVGQEKSHCTGLVKSSEVPKIAVLSKWKFHIGMVPLGLSPRDYRGQAA